jgi:SPP1 family predicted phage head-tail adaptor
MIIGKLDKRIILQKPATLSDGQGGQKKDGTGWDDVSTVWAEFRTPNFKELTAAGTVVSEVNQLISIWRRNDIKRGWQVVYETIYGTRIFKIQDTFDPDRETTILVCLEVTK